MDHTAVDQWQPEEVDHGDGTVPEPEEVQHSPSRRYPTCSLQRLLKPRESPRTALRLHYMMTAH